MMKRILALIITAVIAACSLSVTCLAASDRVLLIIDDSDHLAPEAEQRVMARMEEVSGLTGFHIIIDICDDIGPAKSDSAVVSYADDIYDAKCGINTDGVLLLINNDTKYDYISTSGSGINYLSDARIYRILDGITDNLKKENYEQAAMGFLSYLESYYKSGKANHQTEMLGQEVDLGEIASGAFIALLIAGTVTIIIYATNARQFKLVRPPTSIYMMQNSLYLSQNTDTYVGTVTNRTYSPQSSGGGGGHGGHSSTHHSSGGGRHGGGGHHR